MKKNKKFEKTYVNHADEMTDIEANAAFNFASDERSMERSRAATRRKITAKKKHQRWNDRCDVTGFEAKDEHEERVLRGMGAKHQTMNSKVHGPNHPFEMGAGDKRRNEIALDKMRDVEEHTEAMV